MSSLAGHFLVAAPQLTDPSFRQTVVLMLRHEEGGALGTILNRPAETTVRRAWEILDARPVDCEAPLYEGGPVPGPMIALHDQPQLAESQVLAGLHMSMERDLIDRLVRTPEATFRLYSGHSGWGGGQLEDELEVTGWLKAKATTPEVFSDPATLWARITSKIGIGIAAPEIDPRSIPRDPGMN